MKAMQVLLTFASALSILSPSARAAAAVIEMLPSSSQVAVGDTVFLDLKIHGKGLTGNKKALSAFDIQLLLDTTLLNPTKVEFGDPQLGDQLDTNGVVQGWLPIGSGVKFSEVSLDSAGHLASLQVDAFIMARVTMKAVAPGTVQFGLDVDALGGKTGAALTSSWQPVTITVTAGR